ncbi:MAG: sodium:calcium antiporter [Solirubrobacteraceae bacterium]
MAPVVAVPLFVASLTVTLLAARFFAQRLDSIGTRFGLPEAMIGLLTAVAADGPEISSAMVALVKGAHSTSVGVLVGSNAFNLAAMIGVSALLTGVVALARRDLVPEAALCVAITIIAAAVLLRWLPPAIGVVLALAAVVPYALWLREAEREALEHPTSADQPSTRATHHLLGLVVADVALIIGGSFGMVESALTLGHRWGVSEALLGVLILGPLTSIPNAATAIRLGLAGRSTALVGEAFNSNAINLGIGAIIPALFVSATHPPGAAKLEVAWVVAMTLITAAMLWRRRGIRRRQAAALVMMYAGFVAIAALG